MRTNKGQGDALTITTASTRSLVSKLCVLSIFPIRYVKNWQSNLQNGNLLPHLCTPTWFWTGCNLIQTILLVFNVARILDKNDISGVFLLLIVAAFILAIGVGKLKCADTGENPIASTSSSMHRMISSNSIALASKEWAVFASPFRRQ